MPSRFWASPTVEPKRNNRWVIYMEDPFYSWTAKAVGRPSYQMSSQKVMWINHEFKYPGKITWQPVEITVLDPGTGEGELGTTLGVYQMLARAGYQFPDNENQTSSISKQGAVNALGQVRIQELDVAGSPIEEFTLYNSFVTNVSLGSLTYENDGILEIKMTVEYDYARFNPV